MPRFFALLCVALLPACGPMTAQSVLTAYSDGTEYIVPFVQGDTAFCMTVVASGATAATTVEVLDGLGAEMPPDKTPDIVVRLSECEGELEPMPCEVEATLTLSTHYTQELLDGWAAAVESGGDIVLRGTDWPTCDAVQGGEQKVVAVPVFDPGIVHRRAPVRVYQVDVADSSPRSARRRRGGK